MPDPKAELKKAKQEAKTARQNQRAQKKLKKAESKKNLRKINRQQSKGCKS